MQGIFLIIIGIFVLRNPTSMLLGLSVWLGVLTLIAGTIGFFGYLGAPKTDRETSSLIWSSLTVVLGLLMLGNLVVTIKLLIIFFGSWVAVTGVFLVKQGWELKKENSFGWLVLILGAIASITGVVMAFNLVKGAMFLSLFLGIQAIMLGVDFIIIAYLKRKVQKKIQD